MTFPKLPDHSPQTIGFSALDHLSGVQPSTVGSVAATIGETWRPEYPPARQTNLFNLDLLRTRTLWCGARIPVGNRAGRCSRHPADRFVGQMIIARDKRRTSELSASANPIPFADARAVAIFSCPAFFTNLLAAFSPRLFFLVSFMAQDCVDVAYVTPNNS